MGGFFGGNSADALRGLAERTDQEYKDLEGSLSAEHRAATDRAIAPLLEKAEVHDAFADFRDPMLERALMEGLKQKETQERRTSAQAAGLTGALRPSDVFGVMLANSRGYLSYQSQVLQERRANLAASVDILKNTGQIEAGAASARLSSLASLGSQRLQTVASLQQAAIEAANEPDMLATMLGGALSTFAGTTTGANLIGAGFGNMFTKFGGLFNNGGLNESAAQGAMWGTTPDGRNWAEL